MGDYCARAVTARSPRGMSCSKKAPEAAPPTCNPQEVQRATELLRCFCKAIACSARNHDVGESLRREQLDFNSPPMTNLKKWRKHQGELESEDTTIGLPKLRSGIDWDNAKIACARASQENSLPDPLNMAAKAERNPSWVRTRLWRRRDEFDAGRRDAVTSEGAHRGPLIAPAFLRTNCEFRWLAAQSPEEHDTVHAGHVHIHLGHPQALQQTGPMQ